MDMPGMEMPAPSQPTSPQAMTMRMTGHSSHEAMMKGALGSYAMQRESSGTAWQPDSSDHQGLMVMTGDWMLMAHGVLNLVYDDQSGLRGDDKAFAIVMMMVL
jgi:hypothetical protein